jgi:ATP-binding cassette subfamily B protein
MIPEIERGALRRAFRLFPRTLPYLRPYRWSAGFAVALMVLITVLSLAEPWPLAFLVDTVLGKRQAPGWATAISGGGTRGLIVLAVSGGLLLTLVSGAVKVMSSYVTTKIDHSMSFDLRSDLLAHVQRLSLGFHDDANTGDLMFRINDQADAVGKVVIAVPDFVQGILTLVGMLVIAFRIDPVLALLAMLVIPLVLRSTTRYANRVEPELQRVRDMESTNLAMVHEALATFRVIIAFGRERHESDRVRAHSERTVDARIRLTVRQAFFKLAVGSITAAGTAAVIGLGAHRVLNGQITTGELLVMAAYIAAVYQPLETLTYSITVLQEQFVSLAHAIELLEFAPDVTERDGAIALERASGEITFESVGFSYATRDETLADVSFSIAAGTVRRRAAGATAVLRHNRREHRLRPARRDERRDRAGRTERERARVHLPTTEGLRHVSRRARHEDLRRGTPTHRRGTSVPPRRADPDPGRADVVHRLPH